MPLCEIFAQSASQNHVPTSSLILADDLGWSDLGCYGGEIKTPNIDKLAAGGLRFTQFYNSTRCCPSRASLLTGLYPHQAGVGLMTGDQGQPGYRGSLQPNCVTIAQVLKSAGYKTAMTGKWHVGDNVSPIDRGFDDFYGWTRGYGVEFLAPNHDDPPARGPHRNAPTSQASSSPPTPSPITLSTSSPKCERAIRPGCSTSPIKRRTFPLHSQTESDIRPLRASSTLRAGTRFARSVSPGKKKWDSCLPTPS